ncbi:MAG: PQQ-binding-like beta-propeller repeat protein [Planctomycetia bacterium]|nr:PQQ-binding-like beta-propeller repeat protein [Planctomycetia bacterium]
MAWSRWHFADFRRTRPRRLSCIVWLAAALVMAEAARGRDPPADEPPLSPAGPSRPESVADPPHASEKLSSNSPPAGPGEIDLWHQNLIRERQVEVRLRTAQRDIEAGRLIAGLTALQSILERDDDLFVRYDSEPVPCGAHALAGRMLGMLAGPARETYETLYGAQARQLLDTVKTPDPEMLGRIVRRFYHTAAGFEAGNRLAARWIDQGHDELAWGWWQRVFRDAAHRERLQPIHRVLAAECCVRLGRHESLGDLLRDLPDGESLRIGGRQTTVAAWRQALLQKPADRAALAGAAATRGAIAHNVKAEGSPPALGRPLWRAGLAGEQSRHLESLARAWESHQLQNGLPIGTSQSALLVGDRLVFRDFEGIRAVDVETGRLHWFAPCASSVGREIPARQTIPADGNPDPNNVMRHVVGNSGVHALAADARHVFVIDRLETEESPPQAGGAVDAVATRSQCNVLAAFEVAGSASPHEPKWTVGGRADGSGRPLQQHFFVGPPLAVADRLLVVSEARQQLCLSCLTAETGRLLWTQALCSVTQPITGDHQRAGLACGPGFSDGIVICPTQAGVLVAVDALTGTLLWAASHDEGESQQRQQMSAWQYHSRRTCAHAAYVSLPVIHARRVFYLPAHSEFVHCHDLATGRLQWRSRREDLESATATEYVAAVSDATVLIVGRRRCRGLDVASGAERWQVRLGSSPAGQGIRLGAHYHVPLDDGAIADLDLDSGRLALAPRGLAPRSLGNLIAGRGLVVSLGAAEIAVYPQADVELERVLERLRMSPGEQATELEAAELELAIGRLDSARPRLEAILERPAGTLAADRATTLLREVLLRRLARNRDPSAQDLARLAELSQSPEHYGRLALERQRAQQNNNLPAATAAAVHEFSSRAGDSRYLVGDDPSRAVAAHVFAAGQLRNLAAVDPRALASIDGETAELFACAVERRDAEAARRLAGLFADPDRADDARWQLARLLVAQRRHQEAETALLACRESANATTRARATRLLAELWILMGLPHDAARLFLELNGQFAGIEVADGRTGAAWVAARPRDDPAGEAYRRLSRPTWTGAGARIVEGRVASEALQAAYNGNNVTLLLTPRQSPFDLFDRGKGANGVFTAVNRHTGQEYPEMIQVPGRLFYPVSAQYLQHAYVGNFFPLGGMGAMHGVSLLERKLLWTTVPPELEGVREVVRVGPSGPRFCTFQLRQHLYVLDPLDGHVLWHRDDLEGTAGLMHEPFLGIIGDERALAVFSTNGASYVVYDTASGAELRRGKIDLNARAIRRALGRRLFHYSAAAENRRVRVWDALTDRFTWDEPADTIAEASVFEGVAPGTKVFAFIRDTDEAAYVTTAGTIRVVDLTTGRKTFELPVAPEFLDNASGLRAFRDRERYYFNVQRSWPPGKTGAPPSSHLAISDTVVPAVHIEGDLLAVDAASGRLLWRRTLGKRTLLQMPDLSLPVLVSLSRTRREDTSYLAVEVLDIESGQTLAVREDLLSDRLLQAAYDRNGAAIELRGAKTVIRIEFPASVAQTEAAVKR